MQFSLLTYNLLFHRAVKRLEATLQSTRPDLLLFQEVKTKPDDFKKIESFGYKLADYSNSFIMFGQIFGVATFYNPKVFSLVRSQSFDLPYSFFETLLFVLKKGEIPRTVLRTEFKLKDMGKIITAYNIHLSAAAMNNVRKIQIKNTFQDLKLDKKSPLVIAGDFNFPYRRRLFDHLIRAYNLKEATSNIRYTSKFLKILPIKLKLDYVLYKNLLLVETKRINIKHSDHFPILSTFKLKKKNATETA